MAAVAIPAERPSGTNTGLRQISDTISFEWKRNLKKCIVFCIVETIVFIVFVILYEYFLSNGLAVLPTDVKDFPVSFFSFIPMLLTMVHSYLIYIPAVFLGAPSIAVDFEKQTGHQLFPRISRGRLLAGRFIGLYILEAIIVSFWYLLLGIYTAVKYEGALPVEMAWSLGFALFLALTALAYIILFSALMKNTGGAFALGVVSFFLIFMLLEELLSMILKAEPFFVLTYYYKIVTSIFNMPAEADRIVDFTMHTARGDITIRSFLTPSVEGALLGLLIYSVACLSLAYLRFRKRQLVS